MKQITKEKILMAGAEIIHRKGFNHTGIQEVLKAAGIPKGSFYFYFNNKEDFGLQVIDFFNGLYEERARAIFEDQAIAPLKRIRQFLEGFKEIFESNGYTCGCPFGNLAQEMGDLSPPFRHKLKESFEMMVGFFVHALEEARKAGDIPGDLNLREMAEFIVSSWEGALLRMKVEQNAEPLDNHIRFLFQIFLRSSH